MVVRVELFAAGSVPPEDVWAVVGDVGRLPEWTDADWVEPVPERPVAVGTELLVLVDRQERVWRVITAEQRVLELEADTPRGAVSMGVRVVRERAGSRIVLAGALHPTGTAAILRARLVDAPALRRRFDRWTRRALDLAAAIR